MRAIDTELAIAEFEALWLQARCYEGHAEVAKVRTAIRRVDELRAIAAGLVEDRVVSAPLFWGEPRATAAAGN
jgi:hypothetical protein